MRQLVVHGNADELVPIDLSREYVAAASAAGDPAELIEVPFGNHFSLVDPNNRAWGEVTRRVGSFFPTP